MIEYAEYIGDLCDDDINTMVLDMKVNGYGEIEEMDIEGMVYLVMYSGEAPSGLEVKNHVLARAFMKLRSI